MASVHDTGYRARGCARYAGDHTHLAENRTLMGPTTYGTYLCADKAEYDPTTDTTTVYFNVMETRA